MESCDGMLGSVDLPAVVSEDDSWRCDFESDTEERETALASPRKGNHSSTKSAADMSLKSRVAALAKITQ